MIITNSKPLFQQKAAITFQQATPLTLQGTRADSFLRKKINFVISPNLLISVKKILSQNNGERIISKNRKITAVATQPGFLNKFKSLFKTDFVLTDIRQVKYHYEDTPRDESRITEFSLVLGLKGYNVRAKNVKQKCTVTSPDQGKKSSYMVFEDRLAGMKAGQALEDLVREEPKL